MNFINKIKTIFADKAHFVLTIGADGVILTYIISGEAKQAWLAKGSVEECIKILEPSFELDKEAPLSILVDTVKQDYKQVSVPKINLFEKHTLVKRLLSTSFSEKGIKTFIPLEKGLNGSYENIFINVSSLEKIEDWIKFLKSLENPFNGIYLLPIESSSLLKELLAKIQSDNKWKLLISRSAVGGYRLTVTKNNKTVFSRMARIQQNEQTVFERYDGLKKDFNSTISYIKRMGFSNESKIDVAVITSNELGEIIKDNGFDFSVGKIEILNPVDVGESLSLGKVGKENPPFCDMLYAVWFSSNRSKRHKLKLNNSLKDDLLFILKRKNKQLATILASLFIFLSLTSLGKTAVYYYQKQQLEKEISIKKQEISQIELKEAEFPYKPVRIKHGMNYYKAMEDNVIFSADSEINKIYNLLAMNSEDPIYGISLEELKIRPKPLNNKNRRNISQKNNDYNIEITFNLPNKIKTAEEALQYSELILNKLKNIYKSEDISMTKVPANMLSNQVMKGSSVNSNIRRNITEPFRVTFLIEVKG